MKTRIEILLIRDNEKTLNDKISFKRWYLNVSLQIMSPKTHKTGVKYLPRKGIRLHHYKESLNIHETGLSLGTHYISIATSVASSCNTSF